MNSLVSTNDIRPQWRHIKPSYRLALWIILISLTIAILKYPTKWPLEYSTIQSLLIFDKVATIAVLYYIWIFSLGVLLLTTKHDKDRERLFLLCIFAIGFLYFWVVATPYGRLWDEPFQLAHLNYLQETNHIPHQPINLIYFDFPGLQLIGVAVLEVTGLPILDTRDLLVLVNMLTFTAFLYLLYRCWLKDGHFAALGVMLTLHASVFIMKYSFYFPSTFALTFFIFILFVFAKRPFPPAKDSNYHLIVIVVFATLTITHFVTSVALVFVLCGTYFVTKLHKSREALVNISTIILFLVILSSWLVYMTFQFLPSMVATAKMYATRAELDLFFISRTVSTRVVGNDPLWALVTRDYWLVLNWLIGPTLCVYGLCRRQQGIDKGALTGGILGIILLSAVGLLFSSGGSQAVRFQLYGPLFTMPVILACICYLGRRAYSLGLVGLYLVTALLSFPTFLAFNNNVIIDKTYAVEWAAARFVDQNTLSDTQLELFVASEILTAPYTFYSPEARFIDPPPYSDIKDTAELFASLGRFVSDFMDNETYNSFLIWSRKVELLADNTFAVSPGDPIWKEFMGRLSSQNAIYDNGVITLWNRH